MYARIPLALQTTALVCALCAAAHASEELGTTSDFDALCSYSASVDNPYIVASPEAASAPRPAVVPTRFADDSVITRSYVGQLQGAQAVVRWNIAIASVGHASRPAPQETTSVAPPAPEVVRLPTVAAAPRSEKNPAEASALAERQRRRTELGRSAMERFEERARRSAASYRAETMSTAYTLSAYDPETRSMDLVPVARVPVVDSPSTLRVEGESRGRLVMGATEASRFTQLWEAGRLAVDMHFVLAHRASPERPFCDASFEALDVELDVGDDATPGGRAVRQHVVAVRPIELRVIDLEDRSVVASAETEVAAVTACDRYAARGRANEELGEGARGHDGVLVSQLEAFGQASMSALEAEQLAQLTELSLAECFEQARARNAALFGAAVIRFVLDRDGRLGNVEFLIDSVQSDAFRGCATERLELTGIARASDAAPLSTQVTAFFGP